MTSISPLKFIHKKGVFGNHYKTNEKDLIKEDKEVVEDLIISAVNKGIIKAQAAAKEKMSSVTGGMLSGLNLPGL